jgi:quaternary ammonium compound-resistance protein SugE
MAWLILIVAGLFEVGWAVGLKYTDGFTKLIPSIWTISAIVISMTLLGIALRSLPVGTAYAVWVGIGTVGTVACGIAMFGEPASPARLIFVLLIVVGIIGIKFTAPNHTEEMRHNQTVNARGGPGGF